MYDSILKCPEYNEYKVICHEVVTTTYYTDSLHDALATYKALTGKEFTGKIKRATTAQINNW